jgi:dolichol-phosphate mannosyltransferase
MTTIATPLRPEGALGSGYCVVVPMHNEQRHAEACVRQVSAAIGDTKPPGRLLVVDDGSRDATPEILRRLCHEYPQLMVETHAQNQGYGQALVTGIRAASRLGAGYVLFMDSDLTNDPVYIAGFVEKMREDHDVIKATRYSLGGGTRGIPAWRVAISRVGNILSRRLMNLPIADSTNGFRAVKTELLTRVPYQERGFALIMEELYYLSAMPLHYAEVPYVLTARSADQSPSHFTNFPGTIRQYLKYPVRRALRALFTQPPHDTRGTR